MNKLFENFKTKTPNYYSEHESLFDNFAAKGGAERDKRETKGKHFSTLYEFYTSDFGRHEVQQKPNNKNLYEDWPSSLLTQETNHNRPFYDRMEPQHQQGLQM